MQKAHEFYEKYGGKTIIIARFVPIVRTFAPIVAGAAAQILSAHPSWTPDQVKGALMATARDNTLLTFTRGGWSNPAGLPRPAEQRVRYRFIDGSLVKTVNLNAATVTDRKMVFDKFWASYKAFENSLGSEPASSRTSEPARECVASP